MSLSFTPSCSARISYCITCKDRLEFIKETLPKNLGAIEGDPNAEIVILDYDSPDGLGDWIRGNFQGEMRRRTLRYARYEPAPYFRMAHAKNLAHLAATGDILCSLDADNVVPVEFSNWLRAEYAKQPNFIASARLPSFAGFLWQRWLARFLGLPTPTSGLGGRIALARARFLELGGYDGDMSAWGGDDLEFMLKARDNGLVWRCFPRRLWGQVIEHSHETRVKNLSPDDVSVARERLHERATTVVRQRFRQYMATGRPKTVLGRPVELRVHGIDRAPVGDPAPWLTDGAG